MGPGAEGCSKWGTQLVWVRAHGLYGVVVAWPEARPELAPSPPPLPSPGHWPGALEKEAEASRPLPACCPLLGVGLVLIWASRKGPDSAAGLPPRARRHWPPPCTLLLRVPALAFPGKAPLCPGPSWGHPGPPCPLQGCLPSLSRAVVPGQGAADTVQEEVQEVLRRAEVPEGVEELLDVALQEGVAGERAAAGAWASGGLPLPWTHLC